MLPIVMLETPYQMPHNRPRIRPMGQICIVTLEGSGDTLRHLVALRDTHLRRYRPQHQFLSKRARYRRRVAAAVIGQPFHIARSLAIGAETLLDCLHHQVADQVCIDALGGGHAAHCLQRKGHPHPLIAVTRNLEANGAPASITGINSNTPIVQTIRYRLVSTPVQQQPVIPHDPVNALIVSGPDVEPQHRPYAAIAITGAIPGSIFDRLEQFFGVRPGGRFAPILPLLRPIQSFPHKIARCTKARAHGSYCAYPKNTGERANQFFDLAKSTAFLRVSFSSILRLSAATNCLMRFWASCNSEAGATGSFVPNNTNEPSRYALRHWKSWLVLMPASWAKSAIDIPGLVVRFTHASFCFGVQRFRCCILGADFYF
jgi:hypothetical protein